jgi:nicotinate-nucleotide adenylyltransferase
MKIGLYFGSFNPIHMGHLILAQAALEKGKLDQVWFVVSPQNPFKKKASLLHEFDRIDLVRAAIHDNPKFTASDIEFKLQQPSYTVDTLAYLIDRHQNHIFSLLMGEDNLENLHKWKNADYIVENHDIIVYPRPNAKVPKLSNLARIVKIDAPMLDISATYIRTALQKGESIKYLVPDEVENLISTRKYYY